MLTDQQKKSILELDQLGDSQRTIANKVLGSPSKKSTVGDFLRKSASPETEPKVMVFDIETSPFAAYAWRRFKENIGQSQVIKEGQVLCWAAKELGSTSSVFSGPNNPKRWEDPETELQILQDAWDMMDQADVLIAHNGKKFDVPTLYARFLKHGMGPPSPFKIVDTLLIARSMFRFPSNSLASLASYLGLSPKVDTGGFQLWRDCMAGDAAAWSKMQLYNIQDVDLLEEVYMKLRAWDKQHPNLNLMSGAQELRCPVCLSTSMSKKDKKAYTGVSSFDTYQCGHCGKWSRVGTANKIERKENVLRNIQ